MIKLLLIFFAALVCAVVGTYLARTLALKFGIGEFPNTRRVHEQLMPHIGGFGIYAGFVCGIVAGVLIFPDSLSGLLQKYSGILPATVLIVIVGAIDDLKGLTPFQKFTGQFIAVTLAILTGSVITAVNAPFGYAIPLGFMAIPITYLWMLTISNAVNLMDGLDGLAAGISLIAAIIYLIFSLQNNDLATNIVIISLIAGLSGFLVFNYHPASIFMGDTGSLFLGFILAALSVPLFQAEYSRTSFLAPIITLAIPIGDTGLAFFRRLNKGRHPFKADKDHLHHRLLLLGLSHRQAVHIIYLAAVIYGITAYYIARQSTLSASLVLIMTIMLSILGLRRMGYLEAQRIKTFYGDSAMIQVQRNVAPLSMSRLLHKITLGSIDIAMINLSLLITWWTRFYSGLFANPRIISFEEFLITPVTFLLTAGWIGLFVINNLYNMRWDVSRFDQIKRSGRVILFGSLVLLAITIDPANLLSAGRLTSVIYGLILFILLNTGRMIWISIEKKLKILEYAPHKTLLIGATEKARKLLKDISRNPHLLYQVVGYIDKERTDKKYYGLDNLGGYADMTAIIRQYGVEEVIIAINERSRDEILNLVAQAENLAVVFKIMPQIYDVVSGHKTEEVIGHPLIRLFPDRMHLWQWMIRRIFDLLVSVIAIVLFLPFGILIVITQMLSGIHPSFEIENVVGRNGDIFGMLNFRTKLIGSERRPFIGRFLFRTRLYKFPSLINIILGKMSLVGPRPEPVERVRFLQGKIKFYNRRFQIRPGFTGWAQVRYRYEEALKHYREQLKLDLFYMENMSISFDLRILLRSAMIFLFKREAD